MPFFTHTTFSLFTHCLSLETSLIRVFIVLILCYSVNLLSNQSLIYMLKSPRRFKKMHRPEISFQISKNCWVQWLTPKRWRSGRSWIEAHPGKKLVKHHFNQKLSMAACSCHPSYAGGISGRLMAHISPGQKCETLFKK
jgi:hypothetical protein